MPLAPSGPRSSGGR